LDPLEDVLALVDASSYLSTGLAAGGRWAVRFEPPAGAKFNSVRRGRCLIQVDGVSEPIRLGPEDAFLLTSPRGFVLASDLSVPAVPAQEVFARAAGGTAHIGDGADVHVIGGGFTFNGRGRRLLLDHLPPVVHVPGATAQAESIQSALRRIGIELRDQAIGAKLVAEHLAMVMLIEVVRLHLERSPGDVSGWLAGTADPVVGAALRAMHRRPDRPWTVAELARVSRVSRSTLAARFKEVVGTSPLDYLTGWRIELAARLIADGGHTLDTIAERVGYSSESALSTAFKRVTGASPREYRRRLVTTATATR